LAQVSAWLEQRVGAPVRSVAGSPSGEVSGLTLSSRQVRAGDLFVAPAGSTTHGARYAGDAVESGAVMVLTDEEGAGLCADLDVPVFVVPAPRAVLGDLAAWLYDEPAKDLRLFGVTGTQGKTTVTRLAESALQEAGRHAAVIGTVGTRIDGVDVASALTTPEAPELHALFAVMREQGVDACAMEVSSHALVMGRVDGVTFDVAAFTNLGRDHLDFHADLEDYFAAKANLFTPQRARLGLVNVDDEHGRLLLDRATIPIRTFSAAGDDADWRATDVRASGTGSTFAVRGPDVSVSAELALPGDFNVSNALCAVAGLVEVGFAVEEVVAGLAKVTGVPGRLEAIDEGQEFLAVVDYAHKPDALQAVLHSLRGRTPGRLLIVLGAGGRRDRGKRPLMGGVTSSLADVLVVTDDNPRTESPADIRAEILSGASGGAEVHEVGDRREAIRFAVSLARPGDTLLVAGKGHETGQELADTVLPFDDRLELRDALQAATGGAAQL
jgi:UDP-N-acetylmuramoyl-L-alanyl-D-glutamate--2,6-diaminopimelate ligase